MLKRQYYEGTNIYFFNEINWVIKKIVYGHKLFKSFIFHITFIEIIKKFYLWFYFNKIILNLKKYIYKKKYVFFFYTELKKSLIWSKFHNEY